MLSLKLHPSFSCKPPPVPIVASYSIYSAQVEYMKEVQKKWGRSPRSDSLNMYEVCTYLPSISAVTLHRIPSALLLAYNLMENMGTSLKNKQTKTLSYNTHDKEEKF